jgi:hypothetical protein
MAYRNKITVGDLQMFLCKYGIETELEAFLDSSGEVFVNIAKLSQQQVPLKLAQTPTSIVEEDQKFLKGMGIQA